MSRGEKAILVSSFLLLIILLGILLVLQKGLFPPQKRTVNLYFSAHKKGTYYLQPVSRQIEARKKFPVRKTLKMLFAGPASEEKSRGLSSNIPPGTKLLNLEIKDNIAYLDFPEEIESGGGTSSMEGRLREIVYTATQFPEIEKVCFLINGKKVEVFSGEGITEVEKPLGREDLSIIY
ncbi:MAG: GerMN domain-containing protein [Candidatus Omnitrophica bacterium]|nr:GerMN domain-containing protein [Candidatus Omnitrophota bacterium]